ncbi:nitrite reductase small subunit NirD [Alloalcanivorax sp. C16-1]|uniref:nitrite reductase small subunit NirD n=1 Tax=Alloalcanivorax sp. C16-1 TaxID=3390051 RepID=UPI003970B788
MSWQHICTREDLVAGGGVAALVDGEQVALFYLPDQSPPLYAIGNRDPIGGANVLSRGIVGDVNGELVVASPLYKQHFSLRSGICLEQGEVAVPVWEAKLDGDQVSLRPPAAALHRTGT